ncbi:MAG: 1-deoxy-D-xylulose-5-phosphate reductoisomerase [Actinomycetota bacterium]|nr:1-deoxy-D-xylulose-5-phosphate reductoisomerase [Actinomycetota bacterium]
MSEPAAVRVERRDLVILGSTGSVGTQALEVVAANPDRFRVVALAAAGSRPRLLATQALDHAVEVVAVSRGSCAQDVQLALYAEAQRRGHSVGQFAMPRLVVGPDAPAQVAALACDVVLNAMDGAVGLLPTLAALRTGSTLALANKESLIVGGELVTRTARPGQIVPVDSEHSALAQLLRGDHADDVARLVLTASGGPFRGRTRAELADVTATEALAHPTWDMGPVVTINSATLVNKGLEVIEAHLLFGLALERIDVVVHPESYVHSMVEYVDGSTLAQASPPSMRIPIALALGWPRRVPGAASGCDWTQASSWNFEPLDEDSFPAVRWARRAGSAAGTAPAVFNAANEVAVQAFLAGRLAFLGIVDTVAAVLGQHLEQAARGDVVPFKEETLTVDDVLAADAWAREQADRLTEQTAANPVPR